MKTALAVAAGGAIGALMRWGLSLLALRLWPLANLPIGTLVANLIGCFALGLLLGITDIEPLGHELRAFLATGLFGALTTFSTFSSEVLVALRAGSVRLAFGYLALSLIGGLIGCWLGMRLGSAW